MDPQFIEKSIQSHTRCLEIATAVMLHTCIHNYAHLPSVQPWERLGGVVQFPCRVEQLSFWIAMKTMAGLLIQDLCQAHTDSL